MSCYRPIPAFRTRDGVVFSALRRHDILGDIEIACGQCIGCRLRRAREWQVRCLHEARQWEKSCFLTLTYDDAHLPPDGSLKHRDFQLFMKRVRRLHNPLIRYFMCGEYGETNLRPHYHALLFGEDFRPWKWVGRSGSGEDYFTNVRLSELWKSGRCVVQPLVGATVGYCTRYIVGKVTGDDADAHYGGRKPEYCAVSKGVGKGFHREYGERIAAQDFVVIEGTKTRMPRYYDKLAKKNLSIDVDSIEFARQERAKLALADNTPERRAVREIVHKARVSSLKREI